MYLNTAIKELSLNRVKQLFWQHGVLNFQFVLFLQLTVDWWQGCAISNIKYFNSAIRRFQHWTFDQMSCSMLMKQDFFNGLWVSVGFTKVFETCAHSPKVECFVNIENYKIYLYDAQQCTKCFERNWLHLVSVCVTELQLSCHLWGEARHFSVTCDWAFLRSGELWKNSKSVK